MDVFRDLAELQAAECASSVATVGVFDGVHRGHQYLLRELRDWAAELERPTAVVTFESHPLTVLGKIPPAILTSLDHRLVLLEREQVDYVVVLSFDRTMAGWTPEKFVHEVIRAGLHCEHLLMGHDSAFGAGAKGSYEYLRECSELALDLRKVEPWTIDGTPVSSTEIRAAILKGELAHATELLGRPVSLYGEVIHGDGRGRKLGFPTANLNLYHSAAPPHGVYLADVDLQGDLFPALVNVGRRPTFLDDSVSLDYSRFFNEQLDKVEIYIHGLDRDLYGTRLEARLHEKVRHERRFESSDALVAQIHADLAYMEKWWSRRGGDASPH